MHKNAIFHAMLSFFKSSVASFSFFIAVLCGW